MDLIFIDRLNAKIRHNLSMRGHPDVKYGLHTYVKLHLDQNGKLMEDALSLVRKYWDRARPLSVTREGAAHEHSLLEKLAEDRKSLDRICAQFIEQHVQFKDDYPTQEVDIHYEVYETKVRDEIACLQAVRRREISEGLLKWFVGAAIPVVCVFLSAWLANDARSILKEINSVRKEMIELAHANVIVSRLILDGEGRFGGMPAHKAVALKLIGDIEMHLQAVYPNIREEIDALLRQTNADAKVFWEKYESTPQDKRALFLKNYMKSGGTDNGK